MSTPRFAAAALAACLLAGGMVVVSAFGPASAPRTSRARSAAVTGQARVARLAMASPAPATDPTSASLLRTRLTAATAARPQRGKGSSGITLKRGKQYLPAAREVVFIVPHADDEVLFAGELLARYHRSGARIRLVYVTDSSGGAYRERWPSFERKRAAVRAAVLAPLGRRVSVVVAPFADGGSINTTKGRRALARWLRRPTVVPRGATVLVIGGAGNSDHKAAASAARIITRERRQPLYVYWGYGRDGSELDHARAGIDVVFAPTRAERAYKRWAVGRYDRLLYSPGSRYRPARPLIMGSQGDDVVTVLP